MVKKFTVTWTLDVLAESLEEANEMALDRLDEADMEIVRATDAEPRKERLGTMRRDDSELRVLKIRLDKIEGLLVKLHERWDNDHGS